jgi:radical SAM-linked protein
MASESVQAAPPAPEAVAPTKHRYRLRFRKTGDLRLVSHIDLMHVFERMLRRAALPFSVTQGFHPKPCLVFAQALALGVAGLDEVVELDLRAPIPAPEVLARLNAQAPAGLFFLDVRPLESRRSAQVRRAFYRLPLPAGEADLPRRCADLLARPRCVVERARPRLRRIDIRPYLCDVRVQGGNLDIAIWITPYGAARPEEVAKALGLGGWLDTGAVFERTHLEIVDELPEADRWLPEIPRLADADEGAAADDEVLVSAEAAARPAPVGEPLLPNPLSFET